MCVCMTAKERSRIHTHSDDSHPGKTNLITTRQEWRMWGPTKRSSNPTWPVGSYLTYSKGENIESRWGGSWMEFQLLEVNRKVESFNPEPFPWVWTLIPRGSKNKGAGQIIHVLLGYELSSPLPNWVSAVYVILVRQGCEVAPKPPPYRACLLSYCLGVSFWATFSSMHGEC